MLLDREMIMTLYLAVHIELDLCNVSSYQGSTTKYDDHVIWSSHTHGIQDISRKQHLCLPTCIETMSHYLRVDLMVDFADKCSELCGGREWPLASYSGSQIYCVLIERMQPLRLIGGLKPYWASASFSIKKVRCRASHCLHLSSQPDRIGRELSIWSFLAEPDIGDSLFLRVVNRPTKFKYLFIYYFRTDQGCIDKLV